MNKNIALAAAALVFGVIAITHLIRLILAVEIIAGGKIIPIGASYIGLFISLTLCVWMLWALKSNNNVK